MGDDPCDICQSRTTLEYNKILIYLEDPVLLKHLEDILDPKPYVRDDSDPVTFEDKQFLIESDEEKRYRRGKINMVSLEPYKYKLENCKNPEANIYFEKLEEYLNKNVKKIQDMGKCQYSNCEDIEQILEEIGIGYFWRGSIETNYANRFHSLLWMEEHFSQKELERHNQRDVTLITEAEGGMRSLYGIDILGLADGRPSVIKKDFVRIHKENNLFYDQESQSEKYHVYESQIECIEKERDKIYVAPTNPNKFEYPDGEKVGVELMLNRRPYRLSHRALEEPEKNAQLFQTLFPKKYSEHSKSKNQSKKNKLEFVNEKMFNDEKQKQAIRSILSKSSGLAPFILIGPPGTGKTATLIEAIHQLWKQSTSTSTLPKICICAPSNRAVDVIVKRLLDIDTNEDSRLTIPKKLEENVLRIYAKNTTEGIDKKLSKFSTNDINEHYYLLKERRILAMTTVTAGWLVDKGFGKVWFDYLFIDEAGQSTEPGILIPIAGFMHDKCNLVLAGDPKQLGPVVTSPLAKALRLDVSLIERLKSKKGESLYRKKFNSNWTALTTTLNNNYRSHPQIIKIPNICFYDGQLKAKGEQKRIFLASDSDWDQLGKAGKYRYPILFHGVTGRQRASGYSPSSFNVQEILVMKNYIEDLLGRELSGVKIEQNHIGIISPYRTQIEMIKKYLVHRNWNDIQAGSVDSFQGSEKLIIIISTVRSKKQGSQFLRDQRRFNVAVTRAMALLIVIGDPEVLYMESDDRKPNNWRKLINECSRFKAIRGKRPEELQKKLMNGVTKQ